MLVVTVNNMGQSVRVEHSDGPLELGRRERPGKRRLVIHDPFVSRDHLRILQRAQGRVLVECLSETKPAALGNGESLQPGESRELPLPTWVQIGYTRIDLAAGRPDREPQEDSSLTVLGASGHASSTTRLKQLGDAPEPVTLARWFETLLQVQQSAAGSNEFFAKTASAVVELIGLDRGLVLLRENGDWRIEAECGERRSTIDFSRTVVQSVLNKKQGVLLTPQVEAEASSLYDIQAVVAAPIFDGGEVVGVVYGSRGGPSPSGLAEVTPLEAQIVQLLAAIVSTGLGRLRKEVEAAEARARFEQFASPELARELQRNPRLLEGADREITVLFCDLRGFSSLSERLGAANTYRLLADLMDRLTDCVFAHQGVIVDYFGDGLCAMWNAPLEQPDHADRACQAALDMLRDLPMLDRHWQPVTGGYFRLGIGIHTGTTLVGNAGSRRRMKYGPRGHAVNLASRVEGITKQVGTAAVLTGATRSRLGRDFALRRLCRARLAGVEQAVELYELAASGESANWRQRCSVYEAALGHFEQGRWAEALAVLDRADHGEPLPIDGPSNALREHLQSLVQSPGGEFDGVWAFEHK
ncbi:MAG TPA: adenylate/guanylate cyclase domain-containing protein [Candidatus Anammoximicrobium sp.]|nr:adenylate/guanylate cyclase domain-containing protein [Candidatus Anammoximicrobium sp.]